MAISAGIGFFLAIIALKGAAIVVASPAIVVQLGDIGSPTAILSALGFFTVLAWERLHVPGAILLSIPGVTAIATSTGLNGLAGIASIPPSTAPVFLATDLGSALELSLPSVIFAFLFVDLFDTAGTLVGVAHRAGLPDAAGRLPRLRSALLADSLTTVIGSALGTSSMTSYTESTARIRDGGRTGPTTIVVSLLFLASLFLAPLAGTDPAFATAPAILLVACIMTRGFTEPNWKDVTGNAPAAVTGLAMPLTFSIATGIALGFITYAAVKLLSGRVSEASRALLLLALAFILKFACL